MIIYIHSLLYSRHRERRAYREGGRGGGGAKKKKKN